MKKQHKVYVYGTLMTGDGRPKVRVPGVIYDVSWFPGAKLSEPTQDGPTFLAEVIEVDELRLAELDRYEGYWEGDPIGSLYLRKPYLDGWIYEYNRTPPADRMIVSGDWAAHTGGK